MRVIVHSLGLLYNLSVSISFSICLWKAVFDSEDVCPSRRNQHIPPHAPLIPIIQKIQPVRFASPIHPAVIYSSPHPTPNNDVLQYMHTTHGRCPSPSLVLLWHLWLILCFFYLSCPLFGLTITILNMCMFMMCMIFWNECDFLKPEIIWHYYYKCWYWYQKCQYS